MLVGIMCIIKKECKQARKNASKHTYARSNTLRLLLIATTNFSNLAHKAVTAFYTMIPYNAQHEAALLRLRLWVLHSGCSERSLVSEV